MNFRFCIPVLLICGASVHAEDTLAKDLQGSYRNWRQAIVAKDEVGWRNATAPHRRMEVRNRIVSEKKAFPRAVFDLPADPPDVTKLQLLAARRNGATACLYFFGPMDFGTGAKAADNLLVISFVGGGRQWLYDRSTYINLAALPDVREELRAGKLRYLEETPEIQPSGQIPPTPAEVPPADIIAKVYVFCPGREVRVQINSISSHHFVDDQVADIILGGAKAGINEIQYAIQSNEAADEVIKEPLCVRVYLFSQVQGVKPIKAFEYQTLENQKPEGFGKGTFVVDNKVRQILAGQAAP